MSTRGCIHFHDFSMYSCCAVLPAIINYNNSNYKKMFTFISHNGMTWVSLKPTALSVSFYYKNRHKFQTGKEALNRQHFQHLRVTLIVPMSTSEGLRKTEREGEVYVFIMVRVLIV